jgi:hypothetical protein
VTTRAEVTIVRQPMSPQPAAKRKSYYILAVQLLFVDVAGVVAYSATQRVYGLIEKAPPLLLNRTPLMSR